MAATDFKTLRNLAFFPGYNDYQFYFSSLLTYKGDNAEYEAKAKEIGDKAVQKLSSFPSFAEDDDTLATKAIDEMISFIRTAIEYEKANEIAYFTNKIKTLKNTKDFKEIPEVQELISYLTPENFNYTKIITLINVIMQGVENTKAIANSEIEHIEQVETGMKKLKTGRISQLNGLWQSKKSYGLRNKYENSEIKYLTAAKKRHDRNILIQYTEHGNLSSFMDSEKRRVLPGVKKWLSSVKESVDVIVGHWVTNAINEILESPVAYQQFVNKLQATYNFNSMTQHQAEDAVKSYLVKTMTIYATKNISDILNDAYATLDPADLVNLISDTTKEVGQMDIEGFYDNFGQYGHTVDLFKGATSVSQLEQNSAANLFEVYKQFREEIKMLRKQKKKLSDDQNLLRLALHTGADKDKYTSVYQLVHQLEKFQEELSKQSNVTQEWLKDHSISTWGYTGKGKKAKAERISITLTLDDNGNINTKDLISKLRRTKALTALGSRSRGTSVEGIITGIKTQTSNQIKKDLIKAITPLTQATQKRGLGGQQYVIEAIKTAIENKKISVGGPTFSEIKQGIQESLRSSNTLNDWIGKLNKKNDFVVTVTIEDDTPDLSKAIDKMLDDKAVDISDELGSTLAKVKQTYVKDFVSQFYNAIGSAQKEDDSFNNYEENAKAFFAIAESNEKLYKDLDDISTAVGKEWNEYVESEQAAGKDLEQINKKREEVLNSLKNSFFQSSTMKTYNQYQNNIGFVGGSLGANIIKQIDNINNIFRRAGMELSDADVNWLYNAIINCSPISVVGERHKDIIEDYLGSMAAFALFDEGGAEAEIVHNMEKNIQKTYTTPNILHLYAVNSLYVPGSYVLTKVLEELEACADNAYRAYASQRRGATIAIVNTMNEGVVPNRGKGIDVNNPPNSDPWGTVANAALSHVKLKILFLAGLLDIARDINKTLSNIKLPG